MSDVVLRVNGRDYTDWTSVRIESSLDQMADSFEMSAVMTDPRLIPSRAPCRILEGGRTYFTGRIEVPDYDWATRAVTFSGRSKTGDLDSSAKPGHYKGMTLAMLAAELCEPHGISVMYDDGQGPGVGAASAGSTSPMVSSSGVIVEPGESIASVLEREARVPGYLWVTDRTGALVLTRAGYRRADDILEPPNVENMHLAIDGQQLWGVIEVRGQSAWSDDTWGTDANAVAEVRDPRTREARRLIIKPDRPITPDQARDRALWEIATRNAKAVTLTVTLPGWRQSNGKPWEPGMSVRCRNEWQGLDCDMIIAKRTLTAGAEEKFGCVLECKPVQAYLPEDPTAHKSKKPKKGMAKVAAWDDGDGEGDE